MRFELSSSFWWGPLVPWWNVWLCLYFQTIQDNSLIHILLVSVPVSWSCLHLFQYLSISNHVHKKIKLKIQTQLHKNKVDPSFNISYTNVRGLWSNFPVVELHFQDFKTHVPVWNWSHLIYPSAGLLSYSPLIIKQDPRNYHGHSELGTYIKDGFVAETPKTRTLVSHSCVPMRSSFIKCLSFSLSTRW